MNLIRNGGFERGDTNFWEEVINASLEAQTDEVMYGVYAGKITAATAGNCRVRVTDYIPVTPFTSLLLNMAYMSPDMTSNDITIERYDADGVYIDEFDLNSTNFTASWFEYHRYVHIPSGTYYIRVLITGSSTGIGDVFYIDSFGLSVINPENQIRQGVRLCDLTELTASGNTMTDRQEIMGFSEYYGDLRIMAWSGTNPTGDITIVDRSPNGVERVIGTFAQVIAAYTDQLIVLTAKPFNPVYVKYVIGGTLTDGDIRIDLYGAR